jgi:thioredoxin 1
LWQKRLYCIIYEKYRKKVNNMAVINLTEANFEDEVLKSDKPVLVDFWASWCGPCKMLSPIIDEVSEEVTDVKFCKVNTDEADTLALKYRVMSIPTLLLFKNGEVAATSIGAIPKSEVLEFLKK